MMERERGRETDRGNAGGRDKEEGRQRQEKEKERGRRERDATMRRRGWVGAKRQRGQVPRDSVLSSGAASTRERERGRGRQDERKRGGQRGELISSTHAHGAALRVPRDSPGIPHNIPSPPTFPASLNLPFHPRGAPNPTGCPLYLLAASVRSQLYHRPALQDFPVSPRGVKIKTVSPISFSLFLSCFFDAIILYIACTSPCYKTRH